MKAGKLVGVCWGQKQFVGIVEEELRGGKQRGEGVLKLHLVLPIGDSGWGWWWASELPGSVPRDTDGGGWEFLWRREPGPGPGGGQVGWGPSSYPAVFGCWLGVSNTAG
jgi:hypothetical protein